MQIQILEQFEKETCDCGKEHYFSADVITGSGVLHTVVDAVKKYEAKQVFLLADKNTYAIAGETVTSLLKTAGISAFEYVFQSDHLEPDEVSVGSALMHFKSDCDLVIGVGSGVINDIGKLIATTTDKPYIIVATAPSMDGYASPSSSMVRDGLKISLPSKCPDVIIGDTDVLCTAPMEMLLAGLGDVLAKYIGICEWRIANIVVGEYYCEKVASLIRTAVNRCVEHAEGLLNREPSAVNAVFEGLVISGAAMQYAGSTRPASGGEHYLSHVWDMRGLAFGTPVSLHGLQCAIGTLITTQKYKQLLSIVPNREQALQHASNFSYIEWGETLRNFLGRAAESMIALEAKEGKYNPQKHAARLEILLEHWDEILRIVREEVPSVDELEQLYDRLQLPKKPSDIGVDDSLLPLSFQATRDIRDKYVISRIFWDLGITEETVEQSHDKAISVSVMCADPFSLNTTIREFENSGVEWLHIDVMDGHFVPNFTLGTDYIKAMKRDTTIPLDIHLMVENPETVLDWFEFGEKDIVSVHYESTRHLQKVLSAIKARGAKAFVALNPATPLSVLECVMDDIDGVLIMTVNPGFAGQKLIPSTLVKIRELRDYLDIAGYEHIDIEVDGNVSFENARKMSDAGADIFVAGTSSVFNKNWSLSDGVRKLRKSIE